MGSIQSVFARKLLAPLLWVGGDDAGAARKDSTLRYCGEDDHVVAISKSV